MSRAEEPTKNVQSAILDYFKNFTDLKVTVNEMFLSEDGARLAIQWDWTVTRKRDRKRATTHDAILPKRNETFDHIQFVHGCHGSPLLRT